MIANRLDCFCAYENEFSLLLLILGLLIFGLEEKKSGLDILVQIELPHEQ